MEADRTILFADVCDSTGITEVLGDVVSRKLIGEILEGFGSITQALNGTVVKTIGDEIMTSFESPLDGIAAAVDMQRAMSARPPVQGIHSSVRIGLHTGPVLLEGGDIFGDVVNVSARMVALAAADQVLTTGSTIEQVGEGEVPYRSIGMHGVRGRDEALHVFEVLWRGETAQMTLVAPKLEIGPKPQLEIHLGDQVLTLTSDSRKSISIGRGAECDLVVRSTSASRAHADVVNRGGLFYLEDHSTNGTFVRPEGVPEIFVHRGQALLQGAELIRLGEPISVKAPWT